MKIFKYSFLIIVLLAQISLLNAQEFDNDEVIVIDGTEFIQHKVVSGETIYLLCNSYQVENRELLRYNPALVQGLKVGDYLRIPYKKEIEVQEVETSVQQDPENFIIHKIKRRETPFFVAKKYGIQIEDIYTYNPDLKKFKRGAKIKIPQFRKVPVSETPDFQNQSKTPENIHDSDKEMIEHRVKPDETLFSLSKLYGRPISEILRYNPNAQPLRIGMLIKLLKEGDGDLNTGERKRVGDFFIHLIETGETLYGLTKKYNISEGELKDLNPVLETGFLAGVELKIPAKYLPMLIVTPINSNAFDMHEVKKGETLYRLSSIYKIGISEIKKANPVLQTREGLLEGETILIPNKAELNVPVSEKKTEEIDFLGRQNILLPPPDESFFEVETIIEVPEDCGPSESGALFFETYRICLMLPLFLEANDTLNNKPIHIDTLLVQDTVEIIVEIDIVETEFSLENQIWKFYNVRGFNTEDFLHFYEGVLLAIDSMQNKGMNIELHVYDTKLNRQVVDSIITTDEFLNFDLIIGPTSRSLQKPVADFAAKNRIPFISPLSTEDRLTKSNPYFYQVYPSVEYMLQKTADYISDEYYDSNFIVLEIGNPTINDNLFVEMCREKLYNSGYYRDVNDISFRFYDFEKYDGQGLSRILSDTKENVFIIPSFDEGQVSVA
ncbi:MAG: LysM peptidoglycan-binding domain-containing protein, partial [Mariniphaga sp.]|nr:LysM peptidoglycan-binding domain-containing protein [Mariniphaga sp.]